MGFMVFFGCLMSLMLYSCFSLPVDTRFSNKYLDVNEQSKLIATGTASKSGAIINTINGLPFSLSTPFVIIRPGIYTLEMSYYAERRGFSMSSKSPIAVTGEFEPGHYYSVIGDDSEGYFKGYMEKNTYCIGLVDITNPELPKLLWSNNPKIASIIMESGIRSIAGLSNMPGTWPQLKERIDKFIAQNKSDLVKRDFDNAIKNYTAALTRDPQDISSYLGRAECFREQKKYDEAITDYTEVIKLNPDHWEAFHQRGHTYALRYSVKANSGNQNDQLDAILDNQRAAEDYKSAALLNPKDAFLQELTRDMDNLRKGRE